MSEWSEVVIVGAGPYGLSIAAHLKALGVGLRIFGEPMRTWREHMPTGMYLKSDGFASSLSDPGNAFTLEHYCGQSGIAYNHTRVPVSLATFQSYGLAFQKRFVPELEERDVMHIDVDPGGYRLELENGEMVLARRVVMAVGISHFDSMPPVLAQLPRDFVSHSAMHSNVEAFRGRNVTVVGAGGSAIDLAALLYQAGAAVQLVARPQTLKFLQPPGEAPRSRWQQVRHPSSGLGPGLRSRFYTDAPGVFHHLPEWLRLKAVRKHLGASGGYMVKDVVLKNVTLLLGRSVEAATVQDNKVHLGFVAKGGQRSELLTDYVIAATGYHPDLRRLTFLSEALRAKIAVVENTPILSSSFEASARGLYFTGLIAANSFGPLLRFAYGADFTARRLARHFSGRHTRKWTAPYQASSVPRMASTPSVKQDELELVPVLMRDKLVQLQSTRA